MKDEKINFTRLFFEAPKFSCAIFLHFFNLRRYNNFLSIILLNFIDEYSKGYEIDRNIFFQIIRNTILKDSVKLKHRDIAKKHQSHIDFIINQISKSYPNEILYRLYISTVIFPIRNYPELISWRGEGRTNDIKQYEMTISNYCLSLFEMKKIRSKELKKAKRIIEKAKRTLDLSVTTIGSLLSFLSILTLIASYMYGQYFFYLFNIDASSFFSIQDYPAAYGKDVFMYAMISSFLTISVPSILAFNDKVEHELGLIDNVEIFFKKIKRLYLVFAIFLIALVVLIKKYHLDSNPQLFYETIVKMIIYCVTTITIIVFSKKCSRYFIKHQIAFKTLSAFLLVFVFVFVTATNNYNKIISKGIQSKKWNAKFRNIDINNDEIVFIGNSTSHFFFYLPKKSKTIAVNSRYVETLEKIEKKELTTLNFHDKLKNFTHDAYNTYIKINNKKKNNESDIDSLDKNFLVRSGNKT